MAEEFSESASADTAELFRTVAVASRDFLCARSSAKHLPHVTLFKEIFYVCYEGGYSDYPNATDEKTEGFAQEKAGS